MILDFIYHGLFLKDVTMKKQRGFSLIELLVTLAIIGLLISMLLPAVQSVRGSARRSTCLNNLKQIGLAMLNYESSHMALPEGLAHRGDNLEASRNDFGERGLGWAWSSQLLPQLEQIAIYDRLDFNEKISSDVNRDVVATTLSVAVCPTAGQPFTHLKIGGDPVTPTEFTLIDPGIAASNYKVCAGSFEQGNFWDSPKARKNGIYAEESETTFAQITDGTSNTIMAGETLYYGNGSERDRPGEFHFDPRLYGAVGVVDGLARASESQFGVGQFEMNPGLLASQIVKRNAFASNHPGGTNMLLADGSARFVRETIQTNRTNFEAFSQGQELGLYQRLTGRNDGLVVEAF